MQSYVVKVEREGQQGSPTLVQRTFEEFNELHSKLQLIFPSSKLPRYSIKTDRNVNYIKKSTAHRMDIIDLDLKWFKKTHDFSGK